MSILPLQFQDGDTPTSLNLNGREIYSIECNIYNDEKIAFVKVRFSHQINKGQGRIKYQIGLSSLFQSHQAQLYIERKLLLM